MATTTDLTTPVDLLDSWYVPDMPLPAGVRALQTTRLGGTSKTPWSGFNLGDHVGDSPADVASNRAQLAAALPAAPVWLNQVHGVGVFDADQDRGGNPCIVEADAALTSKLDTVCAVMTADCLPVLFCSVDGAIVAAAHAGWRGLQAGILEATIRQMRVAPATIQAWLGPAIGPSAFEVGPEVRAAFIDQDTAAESDFLQGKGDRWLADIYGLARRRLLRAGVTQIFGGKACTFTDSENYFSYRRDGVTGRMATLIWREA